MTPRRLRSSVKSPCSSGSGLRGCGAAGLTLGIKASPRTTALAIAFLVGLYLLTAATLTLSANNYAPFGAGVDQSFRTAYLTKLAAHWGPVDFAYRGLPWFYPPTSFWVLAHTGNLFGVPAWQMLKIGVLAGAAVVPFVSLGLWSRLVSWPVTVAIVAATLVVQYWYAPYEWVAAVAFVPWWIYLWQVEKPSRLRLLLLSAIGALIISTFYYWLFIGVVLLVAVLVARRLAERYDLGPRSPRAVLEALAWSAIFSSWYWGPLLWAAVQRGTWDPGQSRFYGVGFVAAPVPFLSFDLVGFILLGGLMYLAIGFGRSPVVRTLALLLAATYLWYAMSYLAVIAGLPLLPDKSTFLIQWILAVAAALGAVEAGRWVRHHSPQLRAAWVVLVFVFVVALGQSVPGNIEFVKVQRAEKYPGRLLAGYRRVVGDHREVLLTEVVELDLYLPNVFLFNAWNANYANPVADFTGRAAFIRRLGREHDSRVFALALQQNRFDRITQLVFHSGTRTYSFADDDFPNGTRHRVVKFDPEAFGGFTQILTDGLEILVPPRARLRDASCDTARKADARYHDDLRPEVHDRAERCAATQRA
jgi:galactan 5-O-arabinofuranosyltransferase